eukprot:TRINITY_DN5074_c1_g1_i1.p4 TRINITY_DN5074_c1_g1~~TRINITY_DN5074_c1_g1_i1.p4  ORF type:complete len:111 (-),score=25.61 TRINITY_DN5074_c1_g1_i1:183-515(-)
MQAQSTVRAQGWAALAWVHARVLARRVHWGRAFVRVCAGAAAHVCAPASEVVRVSFSPLSVAVTPAVTIIVVPAPFATAAAMCPSPLPVEKHFTTEVFSGDLFGAKTATQ